MTLVVADTCSLVNFAVMGRVDLLEATLLGRAHWTQAVEYEVRMMASGIQTLKLIVDGGWLGHAIELDTPQDRTAVTAFRAFLGGTSDRPLQHLGEAESIQAVLSRSHLRDAVLLTDDHDATLLANSKQVRVWNTAALLADAFQRGDIGHPAAYELLRSMRQVGRGVHVPSNCRDVC